MTTPAVLSLDDARPARRSRRRTRCDDPRLRVLVLEDDASDFARTSRTLAALASYRCDVRWVATADAAEGALEAGGADIVLLDDEIDGRRGLELLHAVFGALLPVPVVLLTDVACCDADRRASEAGVGALVEKAALTPTRLDRAIRCALDRHCSAAESRTTGARFRGAFDALEEQVAILDTAGVIVEVNPAWEHFASANGATSPTSWRGIDYLAVCDAGAADRSDDDAAKAGAAARGIRELLAGERAVFRLQYPCHSPERPRWFVLRAVRFEAAGRSLVYVAHYDLTERVQAERATRVSEARFRRVLETSHEGICTLDARGTITYANRPLITLLGYAADELTGASIFAFMRPDAALAAQTRFARQERGVSEVDELPFVRRDGSTMWARKSASTLFDGDGVFEGAVYVIGDRTAERKARSLLSESERHFRALTELSSEIVLVLDAEGAIQYANPAYKRRRGDVGDAASGRSAFEGVHPDDRAGLLARYAALARTPGALVSVEYRAGLPGGEWRTVRSVAHNLLHDPAVRGIVVNTEDVTDRRRAEDTLRENERRYRLLFDGNPVPMYVVDPDTRHFLMVNEAAVAGYGYSREEFLAMRLDDVKPAEDHRALAETFTPTSRGDHLGTYRHRRKDGSMIHVEVSSDSVTFGDRPARLVAANDVTDRVAATAERERLIQQVELERARLAGMFEQAPAFICLLRGPEHTFELANRGYYQLVGQRELVGRTVFDALPEIRVQGFVELLDHVYATGEPFVATDLPVTLACGPDGALRERFVDVAYQALVEADGTCSGVFVHGIDVTDRVRAAAEREELLKQIDDDRLRLTELVTQLPFGVIIAEAPSGRLVQANEAMERVFGHPMRAAADTSGYVEWIGFHPDGQRIEPGEWPLARAVTTGEHVYGEEISYPRPGEPDAWIRLTAGPIRDGAGRIVAGVVAAEDITERRKAEEASHRQQELLQAVVDHIPAMISFFDPAGRALLVNREWTRVMGWTLEEAQATELLTEQFPDPVERERARTSVLNGRGEWTELRLRVRDGRTLDTLWAGVTLSDGSLIHIGQDVSERHQLAAQLRQAQKMEAVGRLAGGVAHDFNNLLMVISSYTLMLLSELPPDDPMRADLNEIQAASERAVGLTRQLLAFSRQQVLEPRVIDLRQIVEHIANMLRRLVGEDVEVSIDAGDRSAHTRADPGQIEQVVMNLAVNARDAMPAGGRLMITVGTTVVGESGIERHPYVTPGDYACVEVRDTGCGMDEATTARIFDPFFTTKEVGKGTGLGLATVYGIVKQSGGYVLVDSTPGAGTAFRVLLPQVHDGDTPSIVAPVGEAAPPVAHATLLLAEDEEAFRTVTERVLRKRGYTVLSAHDGVHALEVAASYPGRIDLLLTDVVMPRLSGQKLAERLTEMRGELPVLFMTGYSAEAVANHGLLRAGARLLHKPFTPDDLAIALSELLRGAGQVAAEVT